MKHHMLDEAVAALEMRDADRMVACYDRDFVLEDTCAHVVITDRQVLREYFVDLFSVPGARFTDINVREGDDWAAVEWNWVGSAGGPEFKIPGASIIELKREKFGRERLYYHPAGIRA